MTTTTTTTTTAAPAVVLNADVVTLLDAGNTAGKTADHKAREAAIIAAKTDCLTIKDKAERLAAIQAAYKEHLTHATVVASFRAALAILVTGETVNLAVSEKTEKFSEEGTTLKLGSMEVLAKDEAAEKGKQVVTLTPEQAVAQLQSNDLKAVGTASRESLGVARAKGAGRKAAPVSTRAPFMDEFTVAMKDAALSASMFRLIGTMAKSQPSVIAALTAILVAEGYTVRRAEKKAA
jgi:hypothetical protein